VARERRRRDDYGAAIAPQGDAAPDDDDDGERGDGRGARVHRMRDPGDGAPPDAERVDDGVEREAGERCRRAPQPAPTEREPAIGRRAHR
jgi:hypothetical protein